MMEWRLNRGGMEGQARVAEVGLENKAEPAVQETMEAITDR